MRICVASRRNATGDPRTRALISSLVAAGHHVSVVSRGVPAPGLPETVDVHTVGTRHPEGMGVVGKVLRRLRSRGGHERATAAALRRAVTATRPDLVYPVRRDDVVLVEGLDVPVARPPGWPTPARDLISMAPHSVELSSSPAGGPAPFHLPGDDRPPWSPQPGRHAGISLTIAYRVTATNPGRYLEAAMRRSGAEVTVLDGVLDWNRVPAGTAAVVIVESPYPALDVVGENPGIPLMMWVHHGEHHLPTNLRLVDRYGAHAVLLAHSWHLAHRFKVPVHRFPFGVAPELTGDPMPWERRSHDVAMVGAGMQTAGKRYGRRHEIAAMLERELPGRATFAQGISPEEMAALYEDTRIVVNDGGAMHLPITMRVFETVGAGALLLTEDLPGTDLLFDRGGHYVALTDGDVAAQVVDLLASAASPGIAAAGRERARGRHTYDHRVDELLAIAAATDGTAPLPAAPARSALAALVDRDAEVQEIAVLGSVDPMGLDDRVVRPGDVTPIRPRSVDAVVIGEGPTDHTADLTAAVAAARGFVYATGTHLDAVRAALAAVHPDAVVTVSEGRLRADLGGLGYRVPPTR